MISIKLLLLLTIGLSLPLAAQQPISSPFSTEISADGSTIAFSWFDDIWTVPAEGGKATRITSHPAKEYRPLFSPDTKTLYFNSSKNGTNQIFSKNLKNGEIKQLNHHTESTFVEDISADGKKLLVRAYRGLAGRNPSRLYFIDLKKPNTEELIFDSQVTKAKLSKDGKKILFTRDGVKTYRKGYKGSQASQIWIYNIEKKSFTQPVSSDLGIRWPLWDNSSNSFFYSSQEDGTFNLYKYNLTSKKSTQLTFLKEDGVISPNISDDGSTLIFRTLFDLYTLKTKSQSKPKKLTIFHEEELLEEPTKQLSLTKTKDIDFSSSGLEIVLVANNDLYAMDTVLREPVALTQSKELEYNVQFGKDNKTIFYIKDDGIDTSIFKISKKNPTEFWWQKQEIIHTKVFQSKTPISHYYFCPKKEKIAITTTDGKLITTDTEGNNTRLISESWAMGSVSWSADSTWLSFSQPDNSFNYDIYLTKADGSTTPENISVHPDNDYSPSWSPDGKKLAYIGVRGSGNPVLFITDLNDGSKSSRQIKIDKAKEAMKKDDSYKTSVKPKDGIAEKIVASLKPKEIKKKQPVVHNYDIKAIRLRTKPLNEKDHITQFLWSTDSKKLFAKLKDDPTILTVDAEDGKTVEYASVKGSILRSSSPTELFMLINDQPALLKNKKPYLYKFNIDAQIKQSEFYQTIYRLAWRTMRDGFYDVKMNNLNWDDILLKYEAAAMTAPSNISLEHVISQMLGELNASHLGVRINSWTPSYISKKQVKKVVHLGVDFDQTHKGKGYHIKYIIPNSPATLSYSKLNLYDTIYKINGKEVNHDTPLAESFMLDPLREVTLSVIGKDKQQREVKIMPISYKKVESLRKESLIMANETSVAKKSNNTLGYTHISSMNWPDFKKFEQHIYEKGFNKDGLIIDVRDNGGGFITDHLLTILNTKQHAFTIARNGGTGYPQDRVIYATWQKPIVVLCNQNSFSNAEIFTHAIKTLKRGKIVGVPTAGGVISTGSRSLADKGTIRFPFRGWFDLEGNDMETIGAQPDVLIWQTPEADIKGIDLQLDKGIEVLKQEIKRAKPSHKKAIYKSSRSK